GRADDERNERQRKPRAGKGNIIRITKVKI
ncbi:MAG: hypothetical protein UW02_C0025G0010, partial [Candidatus Nomurabacteria bacterium GW2011_GWB1_43_7]